MGRLRNTNLLKRICGLKRHPYRHDFIGRTWGLVGEMYALIEESRINTYVIPVVGLERASLDQTTRDDLRQARIKTAIGNLAHVIESRHVNWGRLGPDAKGVCPRG